jgi:DNA-binding NarL/FixJ family response regulator
MSANENNELLEELRLITRLLIWAITKDEADQKSKIIILNKIGLKPTQIAEHLGTTANTVSVTLNAIKKKGTSRK